jgi:hypothetical protein
MGSHIVVAVFVVKDPLMPQIVAELNSATNISENEMETERCETQSKRHLALSLARVKF